MRSRYVVQLDLWHDGTRWRATAAIVDGFEARHHGSSSGVAAARAVRAALQATRRASPHGHEVETAVRP